MTDKIVDVMMTVEVERLKPHPNNPRRGDINAIAASLERFGQVKPLIVQRSTGYIVAGNHTFQAAKKLGWKTVQILVKDMDDDEAKGYLVADNRTSDKGTYDQKELHKALVELDPTMREVLGIDMDEMDDVAHAAGQGIVAGDTGEALREKPDFATVSAEEKPARTEPLRDIVLLMPLEAAREFGAHITTLQKAWGTTTVVDTVRRAVASAVGVMPTVAEAAPVMNTQE